LTIRNDAEAYTRAESYAHIQHRHVKTCGDFMKYKQLSTY